MKRFILLLGIGFLILVTSNAFASVEGRRNTRTLLGLATAYFAFTDQSEAAIASGIGTYFANHNVQTAKNRRDLQECRSDRYYSDGDRCHDNYDYGNGYYNRGYDRSYYPRYDYGRGYDNDCSYSRSYSTYTPPQYRGTYSRGQADYYYDERPVRYYSPQNITVTVTVIVR